MSPAGADQKGPQHTQVCWGRYRGTSVQKSGSACKSVWTKCVCGGGLVTWPNLGESRNASGARICLTPVAAALVFSVYGLPNRGDKGRLPTLSTHSKSPKSALPRCTDSGLARRQKPEKAAAALAEGRWQATFWHGWQHANVM